MFVEAQRKEKRGGEANKTTGERNENINPMLKATSSRKLIPEDNSTMSRTRSATDGESVIFLK